MCVDFAIVGGIVGFLSAMLASVGLHFFWRFLTYRDVTKDCDR